MRLNNYEREIRIKLATEPEYGNCLLVLSIEFYDLSRELLKNECVFYAHSVTTKDRYVTKLIKK